jgi:hypothetical protein
MKAQACVLAAGLAILAGWWLATGCDSNSGSESIIAVTPASATLSGEGSTATFTASGSTNMTMVLPLEWTVSDASLGRILDSAGVTAVYESFGGAGNNTIHVRDKADAEGFALIIQD